MRSVERTSRKIWCILLAAFLGISFSLRASPAGTIVGWGFPEHQEFNFPDNLTNVTAISDGGEHVLALLADQSVVAWGYNDHGQIPPRLTNIVAISAGTYHTLALTAKGTVFQCGQGTPKRLNLRNVMAIAAGNNFSLALHRNGAVTAWGSNAPAIKLPRHLKGVTAIAAGDSHALALRKDGTVVSWGTNDFGQTNVPPGLSNVVMIAAGFQNSLALTSDGKVWQWGRIATLSSVPDSVLNGIAQIAVGDTHIVVRTTNGTVFGWGPIGSSGLFPSLTNAATIAAGEQMTFAAVQSPVFRSGPTNQSRLSGDSATFSVTAESTMPFQYQWFFNNSPLPQATNATLQLTNIHTSMAGNYFVIASNAFGSASSATASLQVIPMNGPLQIEQSNDYGSRTAHFQASVNSLLPLQYQWFFDGSAISDATNADLVITNFHYANQGNYSVCVSNDDTNTCLPSVFFTVPPLWSITGGSAVNTNGTTNFITFALSMDEPRPDTQQLPFETFDETAKANVDYLSASGNAVFPPGTTNVFLNIPTIGNTNIGPRSFEVLIFAPSTLQSSARGWILDPNYVPTIIALNNEFYEGLTTNLMSQAIWLSGPGIAPVSVNYSTADGTARDGIDYLATNAQIVFPSGSVTQQLTVTILGNLLQQSNRQFLVNLSAPSNATLNTNQIREVIDDDDTLVLPPGFSVNLLATNLSYASAMNFAPDGRLFICQQQGKILVFSNDAQLPDPFAQIPAASAASEGAEDGLLGLAFDPGFSTNHFIYVYYTSGSPYLHNRVSRFTADGNAVMPGSESVVVDLDQVTSILVHNAGAIHFGPDGKLYVAVGDNGHRQNSQTMTNRLGKMLRINSDGSIPTDNPFYSTATGANRAIWALGLRNPFSFAIQPATGRMLINDVGEDTWEEINEGIAGANYGWPFAEGPTNSVYQNPLYAYTHTNGCAIVGAAFYTPSQPQFPPAYVGNYFFSDFCGGWIKRLDSNNAVSDFIGTVNAPVALAVGPDGALYCLTTRQLYKFTYSPPSQ